MTMQLVIEIIMKLDLASFINGVFHTMSRNVFLLSAATVLLLSVCRAVRAENEQCPNFDSLICAEKWLTVYDKVSTQVSNLQTQSYWNYESNMTSQNAQLLEKAELQSLAKFESLRHHARRFRWQQFSSQSELKRVFRMITASTTLRSIVQRKLLINVQSELKNIYASAQVCLTSDKCLLKGATGPNQFLSTSRDYDELLKVWGKWHDVTGKASKSLFSSMVQLLNKGAKDNGYLDFGQAEWFQDMEQEDFPSTVKGLFNQVKPLYDQLHAFVRHRLLLKYPGKFSPGGVIPAHILGNLWAQQWQSLNDLMTPFPSRNLNDVSNVMKNNNFTTMKIFKTAENFFTSIGLPPMTNTFWKKSVLELNPNVTMECHASAWDLYKKNDFRIKMCPDITLDSMQTAHHEMGHIEYYMAYSNLPHYYRAGANSGFHEAIGDTIALSFSTPAHLRRIGLLNSVEDSMETDINSLMKMALEKIAFLPYGLLIDQWRWNVANGRTTSKNYNKDWWTLRETLQGIGPPMSRSEHDMDAGGKYHIVANVPYIRYFMSFIMQFQFYKAMCKEAGHQDVLYKCDFYNSNAAGKKLLETLRLGKSKPWPEILQIMTGSRTIDVAPLFEYFQPLLNWLKKENQRNGATVGWKNPTNPLASVTL